MFFIGFFLSVVFLSICIDKFYTLHSVGGNEGCMCMYFSPGGIQVNKVNDAEFFQYATESFIKGVHLNI